ncbi:MAG: DUF3413 domain-containing protein [Gammaproteobacteria bacterium]|nr:DUF3413 domain-containing protein [Gammaproteobacteria bacterium]
MSAAHASRADWLRALGWFVLANAALLKLTTLWYAGVLEPPADAAAAGYRTLVNLAHWPYLAALFAGPPALLPILLRPRPAWLMPAAALGALAGIFVLVVDAVVYDQYRMHVGLYVWGLLFGGAGGEIFSFSGVMWALAGTLAATTLAGEALLFRACLGFARRRRWPLLGRWIAAGWFGAFLATQGWHAAADAAHDAAIAQETGVFPFYYPLTAKRQLYKWGWVQPRADADAGLDKAARSALRYPLAELACAPRARKNVLLILIDAWRADQLDPAVTPRIWAYARDAHRFTHHIAGSNATRFGVFALFYGLPGSYWTPALRSHTPPVLTRQLLAQGYDLGIYASAPLAHAEFDRTVFGGVPGLRLRTPGARASERDRRITQDMVEFLAQRKPGGKPFFGFLFYDSAHAYDIPDDAEKPFQPSWAEINYLALSQDFDPTPYLNRHRNAVHFIDGEVGRVLAALDASGVAQDTLVVITADHGEEFNDTGKNYWGHNGNFSPWQVQVPLILRGPGWGAGETAALTSHYDLAPTLLKRALGCTVEPGVTGIGQPLDEPDGRRGFVPVFDYNDAGIYEPERITLLSRLGRLPVYNHRYDRLDAEPSGAVVRQVHDDLVRFSKAAPAKPVPVSEQGATP